MSTLSLKSEKHNYQIQQDTEVTVGRSCLLLKNKRSQLQQEMIHVALTSIFFYSGVMIKKLRSHIKAADDDLARTAPGHGVRCDPEALA